MSHHEQDAAPGVWQMCQGYVLQRFINACAGRGAFPIKFNGSLFTMDGVTEYLGGRIPHDADYRMWGPDYWFQNTRLAYGPTIACGDFDLMEGLWRLYLDALPMARARAEISYGHGGASSLRPLVLNTARTAAPTSASSTSPAVSTSDGLL